MSKLKNVATAIVGIGVIGGLATVALTAVGAVLDPKYKVGPYGKRNSITFSRPYDNKLTHNFDTWRRLIERDVAYSRATREDRDYADRAMLNYEWGYTFENGTVGADELLYTVAFALLQGSRLKTLTWPLPKDE